MARLYFKPVFHDAVRSGRKISTLRRWARPMVSPGQIVLAPHIGKLWITECRPIELEKLTAIDAQADGFASVAELKRAIARIYPNQESDGKRWYRVSFILAEEQPLPPAAARRRLAKAIRVKLASAVSSAARRR